MIMKTFIINLKSDITKKENVVSQCKSNGIGCEVIEAVAGKELPHEVLYTTSYQYPESNLTKGVIGCTLSHLYIYSRMISENLPYALVMEDDISIDDTARVIIESIKGVVDPKKAEIYLLNTPEAITPIIKKSITANTIFYRMARASQSSAYIINKAAAKKILHYNLPIKFEVDRWMAFRDHCGIKIWALQDGVIDTYDNNKSDSSLEEDRSKVEKERLHFLSKLRKKEKGYQTKRLFNLLLKKLSNKDITRPS